MLPALKEHQSRAHARTLEHLRTDPTCPVLVVGPCGSGKSRLMFEMAEEYLRQNKRVGILTHRQMLTDQLAGDFARAGSPYTIFASGYKYDAAQPIQIMSAPTVFARVFRKSTEGLPDVDLLLVDEAHQQTGAAAQAVLFGASKDGIVTDGYSFLGKSVVGYTATPLMRSGLYGVMVEAGTYSEMRACKMHQIVKVFSPDEIDVKALKPGNSGDYSEKALEKRVKGSAAIYSSVFREYERLNPGQLPMILFAPSIETSRWFAQCFCSDGVPVAHLDGELIGMPDMSKPQGSRLVWMPSNADNRKELMKRHKAGVIKGICNRFVLREAVNMPWCYHAILATVMGGLSTYLQAVGRLQRFYAAYDHKILQCHGGHYWRHGSPNEDREWHLGDTNKVLGRVRMEDILAGKKPEGIRCPKCNGWRMKGPICPHCGHAHEQSVRAIRMLSGRLKQQVGRVYVQTPNKDRVQSLWNQTLFSASAHERPVSAAVGIFNRKAEEAGLKVDWNELRNLPPFPDSLEWHYSVNDYYPWLKRYQKKKKGIK